MNVYMTSLCYMGLCRQLSGFNRDGRRSYWNYKSVSSLLNCGGFNMAQWLSFSRTVFSTVIQPDFFDLRSRCRSVTNQTHPRPVMELSEWFVHFEIVNSSTAAIKKTVLQQVTSVLDPLGFLSSIIMSAKVLLQEIGRSGSHWGMIRFRKIFYPFGIPLDLKSITSIQIPRCLRLNEFQLDTSFILFVVAHRVSKILDSSSSSKWRHIPGDTNPADDCSREIPATHLTPQHR